MEEPSRFDEHASCYRLPEAHQACCNFCMMASIIQEYKGKDYNTWKRQDDDVTITTYDTIARTWWYTIYRYMIYTNHSRRFRSSWWFNHSTEQITAKCVAPGISRISIYIEWNMVYCKYTRFLYGRSWYKTTRLQVTTLITTYNMIARTLWYNIYIYIHISTNIHKGNLRIEGQQNDRT